MTLLLPSIKGWCRCAHGCLASLLAPVCWLDPNHIPITPRDVFLKAASALRFINHDYISKVGSWLTNTRVLVLYVPANDTVLAASSTLSS